MQKHIYVYRVYTKDLPRATKEMNGTWQCFTSTVVDVLHIGENTSLVTVEQYGNYPYITNKWDFILDGD